MSAILITLLALATAIHVTSSSGDVGFQRFDCYRDICVSRRQYCSDREQRCKYCQPAQCLDPSITPQHCRAICPELLTPPTTVASTTTATTTTIKSSRSVHAATTSRDDESLSARKRSSRDGFYIPNDLAMVFLVVVVVCMVLALVIFIAYCRNMKRPQQQPQPTARKESCPQALEEEGQSFLGQQWGSKYSNRTTASASPSSVSSQPRKQAIPSAPYPVTNERSMQTDPMILTVSNPQYTARPNSQLFSPNDTILASATDDGSASGKHERPYDYHLLNPSTALQAQNNESAACTPLLPGSGGYDVMVTSSGHSLPLPFPGDTNPKSL